MGLASAPGPHCDTEFCAPADARRGRPSKGAPVLRLKRWSSTHGDFSAARQQGGESRARRRHTHSANSLRSTLFALASCVSTVRSEIPITSPISA